MALASDAWQQAACLLLGECGRGAHESQEAANTPLTLHDRQRAATWLLKASHYYGMMGAYDRVVDLLEQSIMAWPFDPDVHRQYGTVRMSVTLTTRGRGCGRAGAAQNTSQDLLRGSGAGMGSGLPWWGPLDAMGVGAHTWSHMPWEVSVADVFQRAQYLDLALIAARGAPTQCAVQRVVHHWREERGVTVRVVNSTQPALAKARCRVLSHSSHGMPGRWSDCDDTFHARHPLVAEFEHVFLSGMEPVVWDECRVFLHVHGPLVSLRAGGLAFTDMPPRVSTFDGQPLVVTQVDLVVSVLQMRYLSFYHWMVECLSRLVLMKPTLAAHPNAVLLVRLGACLLAVWGRRS